MLIFDIANFNTEVLTSHEQLLYTIQFGRNISKFKYADIQ